MTDSHLNKLQQHLQALSILRDAFENPDNLKKVEDYIEREFREMGYHYERLPFQSEGGDFSNLLAYAPGHEGVPDLIVAAHHDAVPGTPGADDNASGVAVMLETARRLAQSSKKIKTHFMAFNLEEYGMLGSAAYVESMKSKLRQNPNFKGMLSLEMVGYTSKEKGSQKMPALLKPFYPDKGDFLALVGDEGSGKLLDSAKKIFRASGLKTEALTVPLKGKVFPEVRLSDHSPFWDAGIPALLVTDTSFFRNPHYHQPSDKPETLDVEFMNHVTEALSNFITN